jgi:predicted small lipoprotein YifL
MPYRLDVRRLVVLSLVALAVAALAGCGSETPDSPTEAPPAPAPTTSKPTTSTTPAAELLTAADVEKVSGIKEVQALEKGANKQAIGELNFANDKGGVFLVVRLGDRDQFDQVSETDTFGEKTTGVGDDAFIGPAETKSETPNILVFREGEDTAALTTFFSGPDETVLSIDQLKELGNVMAERF